MGEEQDFTHGSIDRAIVLLSIPMILEMMMESLFAVVDIFFVSKLGADAVTAVGETEAVLTLIYSIAIGLSAAATAMVSRRVGEGNRDAAARAGAQTIVVAIILSTILAIPGYFFAEDILRLMSDAPEVISTGAGFTRLMFSFNLPILLLWMLNGIFRGAGDAVTAMRALWIANGVNIVLCPLFIFGYGPFPELGVLGSAVATSIGRSVGVLYQLWHLFKVGRIIKLRFSMLKPDLEIMLRLLKLSAGSTGQYIIASAGWIFLIGILGHISTEVTAGYTLAIRVMLFTLLPSWGMANAAATLVGQNLGAGNPERAERSAWRAGFFNMVFLGSIGVLYLIGGTWIMQLFTDDPGRVAAGALALRIMACGYIFYGYGMVIAQSINGAGDTLTPSLLNFIFFWILEMPLAYFLAITLGWAETGVYWSVVIAESGLAIAAMWVFKRGKWKTTVV
jgi:putative MATE family efflux protein